MNAAIISILVLIGIAVVGYYVVGGIAMLIEWIKDRPRY